MEAHGAFLLGALEGVGMGLEDLLDLTPPFTLSQVAARLRDRVDELLRGYDQLSRDERIMVGRAVVEAYPDLSKAPPEALELDYVGAFSEGVSVKGVKLGRWAFYAARSPFIQDSELGFGALGESVNAVAVNCYFTSAALWMARDPVVVRGHLGYDALLRASGVKCYVDSIESLHETLSGVIVAKKLGRVVSPSTNLSIYCVEVWRGVEHCTLIAPEDITPSITLEGLEDAFRKIRSKYGGRH
ncbi:MAG: hypothetical protein DRJ97_08155 [Thermoprotei archaeon]|nr:MAG: hypothetical protein DRJ97_08155 [Thermoprotei archaeon]